MILTSGAVFALNHLLRQQTWAAQRLAPHAGRTLELCAPPALPLRLRVLEDGTLAPADGTDASSLTVTLKPGALPLLQRREELMQALEISGAADLASDVQFVFRNLEWDFEHDLARMVGDIPARRLAEFARGIFAWQRESGTRIAQNLAEYWTEERPLIAHRADIRTFCDEVDRLHDDAGRLARRIERLG